jgi:hypothetical protein
MAIRGAWHNAATMIALCDPSSARIGPEQLADLDLAEHCSTAARIDSADTSRVAC